MSRDLGFSSPLSLPCFQTGFLLLLLSNMESAWTLHHCASFLPFFFFKAKSKTGHRKAVTQVCIELQNKELK